MTWIVQNSQGKSYEFKTYKNAYSFPAKVRGKAPTYVHEPERFLLPEEDVDPKKKKRKRKPTSGIMLFCPYCGEETSFKIAGKGLTCCSICGISDRDSHVRTINHLWGN